MKKYVAPEVISELKERLSKNEDEKVLRKWFKEVTGYKKSQGNIAFNETKESIKKIHENEGLGLEFASDKYTYNKLSDTYCVNLKCRLKPLVISGSKHRAVCRAYSEWGDNLTADEICKKYTLTPEIFEEYKRIFGLTKTREPLSIEEVLEDSVEDNVSKVLEEKRFKIYQGFEKESWKAIQAESLKWQQFQSKQFDPFIRFLEKWEPPKYTPTEHRKEKVGAKHFVASLSDIHVGLSSNERFNYLKKGWNHKELEKSIKSYANKIRLEIEDRKEKFGSAYLLLGGDICHTLSGFTDKGTKLEFEHIGEEQFDLAFNVIVYFINELLTFFPEIQVKAVQGNHSSFGDYVVGKVLEAYYREESRIKFDITTKRYIPFRIEDTLVILEHGYSALYKSRLPKDGSARENYINGLFLAKPELLQGIRSKCFISCDQHHMEAKETNHYEYYMLSTIVAADRHSDNCGYNNRPRQTCLVIDKEGVSQVLHFFFD